MLKVKRFLHHLFLPHESNNYRAKLLHHKSLIVVILSLFGLTFLFSVAHRNFPSVLGTATDITVSALLQETNQKRAENGAGPLRINSELSVAAQKKADDMFAKDYWAHNNPDGVTPWGFIKNSGYDYAYAGENLARGFTTTSDAINAWMASPDHRRNMLSKNYQDVGFSIQSGKLSGEDTILIVEELGSTTIVPNTATSELPKQDVASAKATQQISAQFTAGKGIVSKPLFSNFSLSTNIVISLLVIFIGIFVMDLVFAEKKKILRVVGHNADHVFYLLAILLFVIIILGKGAIL